MNNKPIKNIFDEIINKKQIYNNVLNYKEKPKKINLILKLTTISAVVIFAIISILYLNLNTTKPTEIMQDKEKSILINFISSDYYEAITEMTSRLSSCVSYDNLSYNSEDKILLLPPNISIPNDLEFISNKKINNFYDCIENIVFYEANFESKDKTKQTTIKYASQSLILNSNYRLENYQKSLIENTEVVIYFYRKSYIATFNFQNTYYQIESTNISKEEFISLLKSIIKE